MKITIEFNDESGGPPGFLNREVLNWLKQVFPTRPSPGPTTFIHKNPVPECCGEPMQLTDYGQDWLHFVCDWCGNETYRQGQLWNYDFEEVPILTERVKLPNPKDLKRTQSIKYCPCCKTHTLWEYDPSIFHSACTRCGTHYLSGGGHKRKQD